MMPPTLVDVTITGPDPDWLAAHTRSLIEDRLVACGNLVPAVRSLYRWKGRIEDETEAYVVLHTQAANVGAIIERTNATHPYDTVHILATEVVRADPAYARWVVAETTQLD
ncbi:MAG: divalent-cation tolerance protein CutA [Acidimicrobiales bacterium]